MDAADSHQPTSSAVLTNVSRPQASSGDAPERSASGETEMPGWFVRKRVKQVAAGQEGGSGNHANRKRRLLKTSEDDEEVLLPWPQRLKQWLLGPEGRGYFISFAFHTVLLLALSLTFFTGMPGTDHISTMWSESDRKIMDFEKIDTRLEETAVEQKAVDLPELQPIENAKIEVAEVENAVRNRALSAIEERMQSGGSGGTGFEMPETGNAVTKGSFTAWTVPADPAPREDYLVVIQVQLPERVKKYPSKDLAGSIVEGTDRYRQRIPGQFVRRYLPINEKHQAQFVVPVPGAQRLVRDTITLQSRLLDEQQVLEIEF